MSIITYRTLMKLKITTRRSSVLHTILIFGQICDKNKVD